MYIEKETKPHTGNAWRSVTSSGLALTQPALASSTSSFSPAPYPPSSIAAPATICFLLVLSPTGLCYDLICVLSPRFSLLVRLSDRVFPFPPCLIPSCETWRRLPLALLVLPTLRRALQEEMSSSHPARRPRPPKIASASTAARLLPHRLWADTWTSSCSRRSPTVFTTWKRFGASEAESRGDRRARPRVNATAPSRQQEGARPMHTAREKRAVSLVMAPSE